MNDSVNQAEGVQELIDRLSQEGVEEGQRQAASLLEQAQQQADDILESAKREADDIRRNARQEAEQYQAAGEDALRLASRDSVREFCALINQGLRDRLQELVQQQLTQPDLIRQMIMEITRTATADFSENPHKQILLSESIITDQEALRKLEAGEDDALTEFLKGLIGEDLRERSSFGVQNQEGLTVRVQDQHVEIDLTEQAVTELLAKHVLPRFRAIMSNL